MAERPRYCPGIGPCPFGSEEIGCTLKGRSLEELAMEVENTHLMLCPNYDDELIEANEPYARMAMIIVDTLESREGPGNRPC